MEVNRLALVLQNVMMTHFKNCPKRCLDQVHTHLRVNLKSLVTGQLLLGKDLTPHIFLLQEFQVLVRMILSLSTSKTLQHTGNNSEYLF